VYNWTPLEHERQLQATLQQAAEGYDERNAACYPKELVQNYCIASWSVCTLPLDCKVIGKVADFVGERWFS
jgi:hypothetical protein